MSEAILSESVPVFVILAVVFGGCSWLAGQSAARGWKPLPVALGYATLIALADRFLLYELRDGSLLDPAGFVLALVMFATIAGVAYRWNQVDMMVSQYPWLYERTGPLSWRVMPGTDFGGASDTKAVTDQ